MELKGVFFFWGGGIPHHPHKPVVSFSYHFLSLPRHTLVRNEKILTSFQVIMHFMS